MITAPANGWYSAGMMSNGANQYISLGADKLSTTGWSSSSGNVVRLSLPVKKGVVVSLFYTMPKNQPEHDYIRFVYAEGSEPSA